MNGLKVFHVAPAIPERLRFLSDLSRNLWWSWNSDAIELFRRMDRDLWKRTNHNPVVFLNLMSQARLEDLAEDESFLAQLDRVQHAFSTATILPPDTRSPHYREGECLAYFSAEFGIHESLPLFAGGLGVLAGDHLKAASNMGLPLVAVGLLYRQGYFRQYLNSDGWQQETYPENELHHLPVQRALNRQGDPVTVEIAMPLGILRVALWTIQVGRIPLFLLDTNLPDNPPEFREITCQLYGGDQRTRLLQEIVLGIGGIRALAVLNIRPNACHMNEGHSAFISFERVAQMIREDKLDKKTALEIVARTNIFTTHTSVPAGHDEFPTDMVMPIFQTLAPSLESTPEEMFSWGRPCHEPNGGTFSMTVFALRLAQYCNGVSELHGRVARRMCAPLWPQRPEDEIPIGHITNGVHTPSWLSPENVMLFERYLGPHWQTRPGDISLAAQIEHIPHEELWRSHELSRSRLVRECRELSVAQLTKRNAVKSEIEAARTVLDPEILTLGFARRFATYKRAGLLFMDPKRLEALLTSEKRPIQIIFSGKSHPRDNGGKELIKQIYHFARNPAVRRRLIFLEDYDIGIARSLVQGVDVWLNTPRRPFEASGTSGMKAAMNGALNVSILDGWWCEGYAPGRGWAIGNGEEYHDSAYQDYIESQALYNLLENDVVPCFYDRRHDQLPDEWIRMMKASMRMAFTQFSSHRMVREYEERFYIPAIERGRELLADHAAEARRLVRHRDRLERHWKSVRIAAPKAQADLSALQVGDFFRVTAEVYLGELTPDEVAIELYSGALNTLNTISSSRHKEMVMTEDKGRGHYLYECRMDCVTTGRFGFTVRAVPQGDEWTRNLPGFIVWAE